MYLFILESIGTSELLLIGIVALIFLGPRRMPEMARKIGKIMSEFRGTANEFKETWRREADFEEEKKAFDLDALEAEPVKHGETTPHQPDTTVAAPEVREIDAKELERLKTVADAQPENVVSTPAVTNDPNDKRNWL